MRRLAVVVLLLSLSCGSGLPYEGLAPAERTGGPTVLFDAARQPLPEIPFPNDLLLRADPGSAGGRRLNLSLEAPTGLERNLRSLLDEVAGFGTFAPITVAFDADLDVDDLFARQNDADPANDAVYLIDLVTGAPVPLDFGAGHYPLTLQDGGRYFPGDPQAATRNLIFPVDGPAANFAHPAQPHPDDRSQVDDLLTFYERSSRTLIVRPLLPLEQERTYAVVLTKRLRGAGGLAVQSPHAGINHASQTGELRALPGLLPQGTRLSDVAYTWAFTTQPVTRELETLRQGLYARGPFGRLGLQYPVQASSGVPNDTNYYTLMRVLQERGPFDPATASTAENYILPASQLLPLLQDPVAGPMLGIDPATRQALFDTYQYLDYFVMAQFDSPSLLAGAGADEGFALDQPAGVARASAERVTFTLAVPKENRLLGHMAPFPVVVASHGFGGSRLDQVLGFAGSFAKFGLATVAIDGYGNGFASDPASEAKLRAIAGSYGLAGFIDAALRGRDRDLDADGVTDPGGDFFTGDAIHTRDTVRQSVIDTLQLVRLLRTFDGRGLMVVGTNTNPTLAGDFNGDGIPDVGGPAQFPFDVLASDGKTHVFNAGARNPGGDYFAFGISGGGLLSGILPAIEPSVVAAVSGGGGGLTDVALRTSLDPLIKGLYLELFGPFVATCNFSAAAGPIDWQHTSDPANPARFGACAATGTPMLVLVVQDVTGERDLPLAQATLAPGDRVMVQDLARTAQGCADGAAVDGCSIATTQASGALRLPVAADWPSLRVTRTPQTSAPDQISVEVLRPGDPLRVTVLPASGAARVVDTFGVDVTFYGVTYAAGSPLVSPARGFGLSRNTPAFRRMLALAQLALEPADPVNYAPHWFKAPLDARLTPDTLQPVAGPANVLVVGTAGDPFVPVETAVSLARAAGAIELSKPDPAFGMSVDQVLIRSGAVEGVANLSRFADPPTGPRTALPIRCDEPGACSGAVVADVTGYGCDPTGASCVDRFEGGAGAPRLMPPLRDQLTVQSAPGGVGCPVNSRGQLSSGCWSTGASACRTDASGAAAPGVSGLLLPYLARAGQSGFGTPHPQKAFDVDTFLANLIGRYFECRGRELRFDFCQAQPSSASPGGCSWIPPPPP